MKFSSEVYIRLGKRTNATNMRILCGYCLHNDPESQGKPLRNELSGLLSVRAISQRYRIIYQVENEQVIVIVVAVGIRREGDRSDIYRIAERLLHSGLMTF